MDPNIVARAARFVRNQSINLQLEMEFDQNSELLFVMRATPWRNSSHANRMILVGANSLDEALYMIATELSANRWQKLDWRARPQDAGVYEPDSQFPVSLIERTEQLRTRARELEHDGHKPSALVVNEADLPF